MVKMFNVFEVTPLTIGIRLSRHIISHANFATYVVYDTSTGVVGLPDYYCWRAVTIDTPNTVMNYEHYVDIYIENSVLYPLYGPQVADYTTLLLGLIKIVTSEEIEILNSLITRVDMVRKRLPNQGALLTSVDSIGDGGLVNYVGGYSKKFSVDEYMQFINGSLIEINVTAPATTMWWSFIPNYDDMNPNPYRAHSRGGVPAKIFDLIIQGSVIRALTAWGLLEVDMSFNSTDSSLAISFDRQGMVSSWMMNLVNNFYKQLSMIKMDFVNSYGCAVGSTPYQLLGLWGNMAGMISQNGPMSVNTIMGYGFTASRPM